ncbi:MAG: hypothetical protein H6719_06680 [Sandaracinaceae bacterium]|nr:hypothetical protein [Sandaracinaceae bacterium]
MGRSRRLVLLVFGLLPIGCLSPEPPAASRAAIAIPGPWVAPARVQAIAAGHFVPVVDPPHVRPLGSCSSTNPFTCSCSHPACTPAHPGTNEVREYLLGRFPGIRNFGTYCCRQNSNRLDYLSVHAIGRAIDLGVPLASGDADNTVGDEVANFLVENAEYIGIQRVIWDHTFWNGERGFGALGGSPHIDHLHIELSVAGAARMTPFFTVGPPGTSCDVACEGNVLVGADCARTDCAGSGLVCLGPSPHCGEPEPPEAVPTTTTVEPLASIGDPRRLTLVEPTRAFDSRTPSADIAWNADASELTWTSGLAVDGVWLNLVAVPTAAGFVTAHPTGSPRPSTSNLNTSGAVRANLVPSPLGAGGAMTFFTLSPAELIGDLVATMGATGDGLTLVDPVRVFDSRSIGEPLPADVITEIDVGAPAGATGVLGTIAALRPTSNAHVAVFPCGTDPDTSTVNLVPDEIASNQLVTGLGPAGTICVRPSQAMHVVIDVLGFFSADALLEYQAVSPMRLVDTRNGLAFENRVAAHQTLEIPFAEIAGTPDDAWAAVFDVVTVESDGPGHLILYACERGTPPSTSAHNFALEPRATLVTTDLGESRRACLWSSTRAHVIVDLLGLWRRSDGAPPPEPTPIPEPVDPPEPPGADADAGVGAFDAGAVDAGPSEPVTGGCSCRAGSGPTSAAPFGLLALALGLWRRRRR